MRQNGGRATLAVKQPCPDCDRCAEKTLNREINALLKAATKFHCENLLLINFDEDREVEKNGYTIRMIPAAEWLTRQ